MVGGFRMTTVSMLCVGPMAGVRVRILNSGWGSGAFKSQGGPGGLVSCSV